MKIYTWMTAAICFFVILPVARGAELFPTERFFLENGLTVLVTPMPSSPMVSVYGLVKTGSAGEGEYLGAGLSHFMEHMLFKGTDSRGPGDIPSEVQALGGTVNAGTHFDYTIYTLTVPAAHFEKAADILSDMLTRPKFDPLEIERERDVVLNEIRMYHDQPESYLSRRVFETVYRVHPYRLPIIGFEDLLRPLERDDFLAYYQRHYVPNNMVVAVAGGISTEDALAVVRRFFGEAVMGAYHARMTPAESAQTAERRREEYYATDLVRVSAAYAGVDVLSADTAALDALAMILGQGEGSRLYQSLVDGRKIAHNVSASNFTPRDPGIFEIRASSSQDHSEEILREIDRQIDLVVRKGVSKRELEKAVNASAKFLLMDFQSSGAVAYRTALDEALTGEYDFTERYIKELQRLRSADIQRAARVYLRPDKRSVVVMRPLESMPQEQRTHEAKAAAAMERVVLENGLTVIFQEDPALPFIWMNMVFQGGVHQEPAEMNGLSNLTAGLLTKGSRRYSAEKIFELTEAKGISFSGFSGQNSFGLRMNCFSRDRGLSLDILSDAVLSPLFPEDRFLHEQVRLRTEIERRHDDILYTGSLALREALFDQHPLGKPVLGKRDSLERISRRDAVDFYQNLAVPSNAVLSVFGDFNTAEILDEIQRLFGSWKGPQASLSDWPLRRLESEVEKTVYAKKAQAAVFLGAQAQHFYHEDRAGLELLGAVLGSSFNGRMFSVIREREGLSYRLGGGFTPAKSAGELVFQVSTSMESADRVREILKNIVRDIQENGLSEAELNGFKTYLIGGFDRLWELRDNRSLRTALDELYGLGYADYEQYAARIQAVTPLQIQELARRYLDLDRCVFLTVLPEALMETPEPDLPLSDDAGGGIEF